MKGMDCRLKYARQTGRTFNTRYKEQIHDIRSNKSNTGYVNLIFNIGHTYGTITDYGNHKNRNERKIFEHIRKYHFYEIGKDNLQNE
jgi:hypothetical protein